MNNKTCGIYKITSPSGRVYIGQSVDILHRFKTYVKMYVKNEKQVKLFRSFTKHGVENHTFEIIEECEMEGSIVDLLKQMREAEKYPKKL